MAAPEKKKTTMGMPENVESGISYLGWFVTGLIFYFGEKENRNVRFHALQSIAFSIVVAALWFGVWVLQLIFNAIFGYYNIVSTILGAGLWIGVCIVWAILVIKAFMGGEPLKLPIIGAFCEKKLK